MKALVCEKNSFKSGENQYYTLFLTIKTKAGDLRVAMDPRSEYKRIKAWFVSADLFNSVSVGKTYDFGFVADASGNTSIGSAKESTF